MELRLGHLKNSYPRPKHGKLLILQTPPLKARKQKSRSTTQLVGPLMSNQSKVKDIETVAGVGVHVTQEESAQQENQDHTAQTA